ncbi:MAG: hypothetical protein QOI57_1084 [Rubrobacteraceae bacterium]|jgi:hypothetical protein|nr:hypothetical protein [Rubrobacteraceae bacterium]
MRLRRENLGGARNPDRPYTHGMKEAEGNKEARVSEVLEASVEECELCGTEMFGLHCKLICPNCGYRRDCSDP